MNGRMTYVVKCILKIDIKLCIRCDIVAVENDCFVKQGYRVLF